MDEINKMFEVWLEQHKRSCGNDTFTNRELNGYKDAWNTSREQLIQELREYCSKGFECGYGEVISCQDLLAKLDLLEKGVE